MSYFQSKPQFGGLLGNFGLPDYTAGVQIALAENAARPKPKKDLWWLGAIGDAMQTFGGQEGTYAPAMAKQQQAEMEEHRRQLQRSEEMTDWVTKEQYKRDNEAPDVPELARTIRYYRSIGRDDIADGLEARARW
jgi:hypothetical protein